MALQGYGCPLSAVTATHPEVCALAQALVEQITGLPVTECCDRTAPPVPVPDRRRAGVAACLFSLMISAFAPGSDPCFLCPVRASADGPHDLRCNGRTYR